MITATSTTQMAAPTRSKRSGRNLSTIMSQASDPGNEDTAVGSEDAAEVRVGLEGCDEPVSA
jgi:hypothetical protein